MSYLENGKKKEVEFAELYCNPGDTIIWATPTQDIKEHWEFQTNDFKFDVKSAKKENRYDNDPDENIHWIELINVNGDTGSLYGLANYFAFEIDDYWLVVEKFKLQKFIAVKCEKKIICKRPKLYQLYTRNGKKDCITLAKTIDLILISNEIIRKTDGARIQMQDFHN